MLTAFFTYLLIWWVVLFTVLPLGVEPEKTPQIGNDAGAPEHPGIKRKLILTTLISAGVWVVFYLIVWFFGADIHSYFYNAI